MRRDATSRRRGARIGPSGHATSAGRRSGQRPAQRKRGANRNHATPTSRALSSSHDRRPRCSQTSPAHPREASDYAETYHRSGSRRSPERCSPIPPAPDVVRQAERSAPRSYVAALLRVDVDAEVDALVLALRRRRAGRPRRPRAQPRARCGALTTSTWRSRPRRRNRAAGPSTTRRRRAAGRAVAERRLETRARRSPRPARGARLVGRADDPDQVRERRVASARAALELAGEEAVAVVAGGVHDRARLAGRSSARARAPRAPRPTRPASWAISANVRSSARKSGKRSVASASSTTPSVDVGEVVALGDHLRADQHAAVGRLEAAQQRADAAVVARRPGPSRRRPCAGRRASDVGVEAEDREARRRRATRASSCCRRSVPAPWRATDGRGAVAAALRHRLAVAAVVAGEEAAGAVQHERDVAVRAAPHAPARAAGEEVRPAAAVEQHDRLAARARAPRASACAVCGCRPCEAARRACRAPAPRGSGRPSTRRGSATRGQALHALRRAASRCRAAARAPLRRARSAATSRAS